MKKIDNQRLATVGKLVGELSGYDKEYPNFDVVVWIPDGSTLCIVGARLDKDGDLRLEVEEVGDEGGDYDVDALLEMLRGYDQDTRVYLAGHGLYFNIDQDGGIFAEPGEEDETVGCYATAFGGYKVEPPVFRTAAENRVLAEEARKKEREERIYAIVLVALSVAVFCWLLYNVYTLVTHSWKYVWENIMWVFACLVILVINVLTLHYSKETKK